jgi:hypothetical protein
MKAKTKSIALFTTLAFISVSGTAFAQTAQTNTQLKTEPVKSSNEFNKELAKPGSETNKKTLFISPDCSPNNTSSSAPTRSGARVGAAAMILGPGVTLGPGMTHRSANVQIMQMSPIPGQAPLPVSQGANKAPSPKTSGAAPLPKKENTLSQPSGSPASNTEPERWGYPGGHGFYEGPPLKEKGPFKMPPIGQEKNSLLRGFDDRVFSGPDTDPPN